MYSGTGVYGCFDNPAQNPPKAWPIRLIYCYCLQSWLEPRLSGLVHPNLFLPVVDQGRSQRTSHHVILNCSARLRTNCEEFRCHAVIVPILSGTRPDEIGGGSSILFPGGQAPILSDIRRYLVKRQCGPVIKRGGYCLSFGNYSVGGRNRLSLRR